MTEHNMTEDILEFKQQYVAFLNEQLRFPQPVLDRYNPVTLLSETRRSQLFLITDRKSKEKLILKVYDTPDSETEPALARLRHPRIPRFVASYPSGGKTYLIREYVEGRSLAELLQERGTLSASDARSVALQLCDVLIYLHGREKPVIHRDIKAENVIVSDDLQVKLVDFDIAREYSETARNDTVYYGTKDYSPPEQFGYAQTDARTDIYALGVLTLFMLTGGKHRSDLEQIPDRSLRRIIETCLAFAPEDRYPGAAALRKALLRAGKPAKRMRVRWAALLAAAALLVGLCAGVALERGGLVPAFPAGGAPAANGTEAVVFQSPLVEQAVRLQLRKEVGEPIDPQELQTVERLHICGDRVYDGAQRLLLDTLPGFTNVQLCLGSYEGERVPVSPGGIDSLEDLASLPNLQYLDVIMQNITDLSPLGSLPLLELNVAGNQITDISPLADIPTLQSLNLDGNPVADISALSALSDLRVLNASAAKIRDVSPLKDLRALRYLYLNGNAIRDVSPLADLTLTDCFMKNNQIEDFSPLINVETLQTDGNP